MTLKRTLSILSAIGIIMVITSLAVFFGDSTIHAKITGTIGVIGGIVATLLGRYGFKNVDL